MELQKYYLALDLIDDPVSIAEYEKYHRDVWPEVIDSIRASGILSMEIFRVENRLFMVMEVSEGFSFKNKEELDRGNSKVQEWEELMWKYQQAIPNSKSGEKWRLMKKVFEL